MKNLLLIKLLVASCPNLQAIPHGSFIPDSCTNRRVAPGEICKLHCSGGRKPKAGLESFMCDSNLQWTPFVSRKELFTACTKSKF